MATKKSPAATKGKAKAAKPGAAKKTASPKVKAAAPKEKASTPKPKAAAPKIKSAAPKAKAPAPKVKAAAPKIKAATPKEKVSSPKVKASAPKAKATAPKTKAAAPKGKTALSPLQVSLLARLSDAVPMLDDECLEALVHSAENLAESCRQDKMLEDARAMALQIGGAKGAKAGKKKPGKASGKDGDASPVAASVGGVPAPLKVEASEDGRFFHIVVDGKWKMLDRDELKHLVAIATSGDPEPELRNRMFRWLKKERSDALMDLGISSALSPILEELVVYLKAHFKVKK